jgi:AcrR family transcriptional regulator
MAPKSSKPSGERRQEILSAASDLIAAQGFLPVPVEQIARAAGVSRALIYAYFPGQHDLYAALAERDMRALADALRRIPAAKFPAAAKAWAETYFDTVAERGVVLHTLMTDPYLDERRSQVAVELRNALWRRMLRASRSYLSASPQDRVALLAILLAIPEELGRLARRGELARDRGRALCARLTLSSLRGARAAAKR